MFGGLPHTSEETGFSKDGALTHWIVRTTPVKNDKGEIIAAMEMNVDITQIKQLEEELRRFEMKYHEIFNNIPNPVFVLDVEDLTMLDCNESVKSVYGFDRNETLRKSFLDLSKEMDSHVDRATKIITHMRQFGRKSDMTSELVQVNEVLQKAFEIFSRQLKLRGIEIEWQTQNSPLEIMADNGQLE